MRTYGLIGKKLEHSFSKKYFENKFANEKIYDSQYLNFEINRLSEFKKIISEKKIYGLNITTPYKKIIIPYLDELSGEAKEIGAVNTIRLYNGKLIGYNTDFIGFIISIKPLLKEKNKALILGDGGAAQAIKYSLKKLNIEYKIVNRNSSFNYLDIDIQTTDNYNIIINTTPLGMYPKTDNFPKIPYKYLNEKHLLYDLIYNPKETKFLSKGKVRKTQTMNGLNMLEIQAEESWKIWNP